MGFLRHRHEKEQEAGPDGQDLYAQKRESLREQLELAAPAVSFFQSELGEPLRDQQVDDALEVIKKVQDTLVNETHQAIAQGVHDTIRYLRYEQQRICAAGCQEAENAETFEQQVSKLQAAGYTESKGWWDGSTLTDEPNEQSIAQHFGLGDAPKQAIQLKRAKFEALHMRMKNEGWNFIFDAMDRMFNEVETAGYLLGQIHSHYTDEESRAPDGILNIDGDLCPEF
jgi:hypothetical protein